jgi:NO-binding membrane sensor protein with MHYT domain
VTHVYNFSYGALNPVLAYLVSCMGCFLGLRCTTRARASAGRSRAYWLTLATLAISTTGIWVMHFIAMLGFTVPNQTIRYNVPVTLASMLAAILVVGGGLFIVGFSPPGPRPLLAGGVIIGIGVAAMHYTGMAAVEVSGERLSYNPLLVAVSVIIAVTAGIAALWAALTLDTVWSTVIAALIMGVAVSGMHYTGMAALRVYSAPGQAGSTAWSASGEAFLFPLILGICTVGFLLAAVVGLSPTAAEMTTDAELMRQINQRPRPQHGPRPRPHDDSGSDSAGSLFRG